jgi:hypothetical protein
LAYRTKPWKGVTGDIPLSAALDDVGEVFLVKRSGGRWNYYSRRDLEIPRAGEIGMSKSETEDKSP